MGCALAIVRGGSGRLGEDVVHTMVKHLGQKLARSGAALEEGEVVKHLFQRLSVLLMRGNSQLILSRSPSHPDTAISGDL